MDSIAKVRPAVLEKYGLRLIVVSNGSWKMIKPYKSEPFTPISYQNADVCRFAELLGDRCPYPIYTDRPKNVYNALGMTLRTFNAGKEKDGTVGKYIKHSLGGSIWAGVAGGLQMPIKPPGDQQQLGGEFILGPGLQVKFTHRMKSTRNHAEIELVLASVDVDLEKELEILAPTPMVATPVVVPPSPAMTNRSKRVSTHGTGNKLQKEPVSPNSTPKLGTWLHKKNINSKQAPHDKRPLVRDLGISSATVFAASNDNSVEPSPDSRNTPQFQTETEPPSSPEFSSGDDHTEQEDDYRRESIPHKIPTPTPHSPLSTHFLQVQDAPVGGPREFRRRPSSMGALTVPSALLTSADLQSDFIELRRLQVLSDDSNLEGDTDLWIRLDGCRKLSTLAFECAQVSRDIDDKIFGWNGGLESHWPSSVRRIEFVNSISLDRLRTVLAIEKGLAEVAVVPSYLREMEEDIISFMCEKAGVELIFTS
jgi:hypothetical protein